MTDGISCDRCGKSLLVDEDVRYRMTIDVVAAYDPLEITAADLARDLDDDIRETIDSLSRSDAARLESDVRWRREFDLCPSCQRAIAANPLGL